MEELESRPHSNPRRWLSFVISVAITGVFLVNFCDLVFQCGCRSLWNGADAHCNVHDPASRDCPWCAHRPWGDVVPLGAIIGAQAGLCFSRRGPFSGSFVHRLTLSLMMFPLVGGVVALGFGLATGYWS